MTGHLSWWSRRWLDAVEQRAQLDPNRLPRAKRYARSGSVGELVVAPGEVRATVAGRDSRPYDVRIRVRRFTDDEWRRVLEAIGAQVAHPAALLAGELPPDVGAAIEQAGLALLPGPVEIGPRCTCPDDADPCKHAAAVCYLVADALDADPFVAFLLRGRSRDEVLAGLRGRRREPAPAPAGTTTDATTTDAPTTTDATTATAQPTTAAVAAPGHPQDPGVDARAVLAAVGRPPIPAPPAPPRRPGRPAAWPIDPPPEQAGLRTDLLALAADAAHRAWELAVGAAPDARLTLDGDADLARRADRAFRTPEFSTLAARSGVAERELTRWALAWRHGGPAGFEVLRGHGRPADDHVPGADHLLAAARTALGGPAAAARIRGDRVTAGGRQLRLGRDDRWYPYQRVRGQWEPAGPASADPAAAVSRAWPEPSW